MTTAIAIAIAAVVGPAHGAVRAGGFEDPAGDATGGAPDITALTLRKTAAGLDTFHVAVVLPSDRNTLVTFFVDEDANPSTGDPSNDGADFAIDLYFKENSFMVSKWDATANDWVHALHGADLTVATTFDGVDFTVNRDDLGGATNARVFVLSAALDDNDVVIQQNGVYADDWAPDEGEYAVDLSPLTLAATHVIAGAPKAGKPFSFGFVAQRSDSGGDVGASTGNELCSAKLGGKPFAAASRGFHAAGADTQAVCKWRLPKNAKGKVLSVTLTVSDDGATVRRTFKAKVR